MIQEATKGELQKILELVWDPRTRITMQKKTVHLGYFLTPKLTTEGSPDRLVSPSHQTGIPLIVSAKRNDQDPNPTNNHLSRRFSIPAFPTQRH